MSSQTRDQERFTVTVVTVDDQAAFRQAAREVIEATPGFESRGEAASGEEALVLAGEVDPDLVFVDLRMPGMNGVETARRLCAAHPTSTIVLVTTEDWADLPAGAERCGAVALLSKEKFGPAALRRLWTLYGLRASRVAPSSDPGDAARQRASYDWRDPVNEVSTPEPERLARRED